MAGSVRNPSRIRVMMIGPFPRAIDQIDGGVAAATVYLAQGLMAEPGIDLIGVRICNGAQDSAEDHDPRLANGGSAAR